MPNHCHVLIECLDSCPLWKIVNSWKSYTARWINANVLGQKEDKKKQRKTAALGGGDPRKKTGSSGKCVLALRVFALRGVFRKVAL